MNLWANMKFSVRNSGLTLGLALLLFACEDPGTIGIETEGDNLNFRVFYKKFVLPATLIQSDSILTSSSGSLLVGRQSDANFGEIIATSYSEVWLNTAAIVDPSSVYDSLILQFKYDYVYGEDIESFNNVKVYQLEETLVRLDPYYSFSSLEFSDEPIGETTFQYITETIDDSQTVRFDTTLRIPLSDALGQEWMDKMLDENDTTFDSNFNFIDYFNGIALRAGDSYETISGFNIIDARTTLNLFYHFTNADSEIDNRNISFSLDNAGHFHQLEVDRSGSPISEVTEFNTEYTASNNMLYVQSGTGLVTKIDFSEFRNFTDTIEALIINRADLTLGEIEPFETYTPPPSPLVYYISDSQFRRARTEEDSLLRTVQEDNPAIDPTGTRFPLQAEFLGEDDPLYSDPISSFLQAIYNGRIEETDILIFPDFSENNSTVNRFLLDPGNIVLVVYYTTSVTTEDSN